MYVVPHGINFYQHFIMNKRDLFIDRDEQFIMLVLCVICFLPCQRVQESLVIGVYIWCIHMPSCNCALLSILEHMSVSFLSLT